jgi:hypothetical protein
MTTTPPPPLYTPSEAGTSADDGGSVVLVAAVGSVCLLLCTMIVVIFWRRNTSADLPLVLREHARYAQPRGNAHAQLLPLFGGADVENGIGNASQPLFHRVSSSSREGGRERERSQPPSSHRRELPPPSAPPDESTAPWHSKLLMSRTKSAQEFESTNASNVNSCQMCLERPRSVLLFPCR